ncbi:DUF3597 domain-containing protein [Roseateles violae]|uniref:DUF3597 domain-containing protein n=1 Tax=Roseateles violae TaxID=3058042 RepID=A0ABT8DN60_9BURK|nr:DUF3597 domain-containing protein [Pelomonas sp. PFR6]MDN3919431.1 DUF3597 domain-containing protein [Pelomonas sp. PFR6]
MSIFSKILSKLGFGADAAATPAATPANTTTPTATAAPGTPAAAPPAGAAPAAAPAPAAAAPRPAAISEVDVVAKLEGLAAQHAERLNWKTSIVDLMKLLGLDSSLAARKELAAELGCPPEKMADSAQMNIWLHKTVLTKLAANGGNIPPELL